MHACIDTLWNKTRVYRHFNQSPDRPYSAILYLDNEKTVYVELEVGAAPRGDFYAALHLVTAHVSEIELVSVIRGTLATTREAVGEAFDRCLVSMSLLVEA